MQSAGPQVRVTLNPLNHPKNPGDFWKRQSGGMVCHPRGGDVRPNLNPDQITEERHNIPDVKVVVLHDLGIMPGSCVRKLRVKPLELSFEIETMGSAEKARCTFFPFFQDQEYAGAQVC